MSPDTLKHAADFLHSRPNLKCAFLRAVVDVDAQFRVSEPGFRDSVTGPLIDALHLPDEILRKQLSNGTVFEYLYRSKIAREFTMSFPECPDHVWEPQTTKLLVHFARGATTVVVGGAYFGDHAILIARELLRSGGTVHAFEPNPDQRKMLERNASLNGLSNVVANAEGLWNLHRAQLALAGFDAFACTVDSQEGAVGSFQTVRIDEYLSERGAPPPQLIMIDSEGAEFRALQGAERFLRLPVGKAPYLVFEIHSLYVDWSRGLANTDIVAWLEGLGYEVYAVRDFMANFAMTDQPVELVPCRTVYLEGPPHGFNMVAIKDKHLLDSPFFRIVPSVSPKLLLGRDPKLHLPLGGLH